MDEILEYRQMLIHFYKRNETLLQILLKGAVSFFIFFKLGSLSFGQLSFGRIILISIFCMALSTVISAGVFLMLVCIVTGVYLSFASIELAVCVVLLFFMVFIFYAKIFPKESLLIPGIILCYYFKVPYAAVLFAGLYIGIMGMVPVICGTFLWRMAPILPELVACAPRESFAPLNIPDSIMAMAEVFTGYISGNGDFVWEVLVFIVVIAAVAMIGSFAGSYAKELAIVIGGVCMLFIFLIMDVLEITNIGMLWMSVGSILSVLLVEIMRFFEVVLDYPSSTRVEFEDNENYYYVKIVPKLLSEKHKRDYE